MKGSFPAGAESVMLSHAFTEVDPKRPQPRKELVSNGPEALQSTPITLVVNQRPEMPRKLQASRTPPL